MTVRDFKKEDFETFLIFCDRFYNCGAALFPVAKENFEKTFEAVQKKTAGLKGFVMEEDARMAGYCLVNFFWSSEAGGVVGMIDEFYVDAQFRNKGIGGQFLDYLFEKYKDIAAFRLEVCESNKKAIKLYESYDFEYLNYRQMIKKMS